MAPAHQLRLSLTGSEDGEAETETCRVAKPLWRKTNRPSGPSGLNLTEPPGADPHAGWCGRGEWATTPPMPIGSQLHRGCGGRESALALLGHFRVIAQPDILRLRLQ